MLPPLLFSAAIASSRRSLRSAAAMSTSGTSQSCSSGKSAVVFLHGLGDVSYPAIVAICNLLFPPRACDVMAKSNCPIAQIISNRRPLAGRPLIISCLPSAKVLGTCIMSFLQPQLLALASMEAWVSCERSVAFNHIYLCSSTIPLSIH